MKSPWKTLSSKIVHRNPWWSVRRDAVIRPNGPKGEYYVVETPNSVFVIPVDDRGRIVLQKQFRYPTQRWSWEIVAGRTDGEPFLKAAKRELEEETGLCAAQWQKIGKLDVWNSVTPEVANIFVARGLSDTGWNNMIEDAIAEINYFSPQQIRIMTRKGMITDMHTLACLNLYWSIVKTEKG